MTSRPIKLLSLLVVLVTLIVWQSRQKTPKRKAERSISELAQTNAVNLPEVIKRTVDEIQIGESKNLPIEFSAKTVDPDGTPIPGVLVEVLVRKWSGTLSGTEGVSIKASATSGLDGVITFPIMEGDILNVEKVHKDGYVAFKAGLTAFAYGPNVRKVTQNPSPSTPHIIRLYAESSQSQKKLLRNVLIFLRMAARPLLTSNNLKTQTLKLPT